MNFLTGLLLAVSVAAQPPKNVMLFIGDGMSVPQRMVAEEFSRKLGLGALAMNSFPHEAMMRTYSASSLVTDSAAAATAIACGVKTKNGYVGMDGEDRPVESCAEAARRAGRKVGIVSSVTINHATPAGFYAHRPSRTMLYDIGRDLVDSDFDLFLGGGLANANDKTNGVEYVGNLYDLAARRGWLVTEGKDGFEFAKTSKAEHIWWRNGEEALPYAIDAKPGEPRLPDLTRFALERLEDGFFLMVEGGRIDWAGHANDAATNLRDLLELDQAVKVALEFQQTHPDTLIVVTGDHETGGMSMGFAGTGYAFYMERLAGQRCSIDEFSRRYHELKDRPGTTFDDVKTLIAENFGLKFDGDASDPMTVSAQDVASLERHYRDGGLSDKVRRLVSDKAGVGWTSGSHTGLPALTTAIGPGAEMFSGFLDNTDISKIVKSFWTVPSVADGLEAGKHGEKERAKVLSVDDSALQRLGHVQYGTQTLEVEILSGPQKGSRFFAGNTLRGQMELDTLFIPGDIVTVYLPDDAPEGTFLAVGSRWHLGTMFSVFAVFAILLVVFGGRVGVNALWSFVFCCLVIWKLVVPLMLEGWSASLVAFAATAAMTALIMLCVGGWTRKAFAAFLGAMLGVGAGLWLAHFLGAMLGVNGATLPFVQTLVYSGAAELDLADVFIAATVLAGSGAMMDLSMDIAAGVCEVARHNPTLGFRELCMSGIRIGRATVGTMTTTLLLAYSGGYITLLMVFAAQGTSPLVFLNSPIVVAEFAKTLAGSFAIVLVAPFTALVSAILFALKRHK